MPRRAPVVLVAVGLLLLLGSYVWYTQTVIARLRHDATRTAQLFARVYGAVANPSPQGGDAALLDVLQALSDLGVPTIITDSAGTPVASANLPFDDPPITAANVRTDPRVRDYVKVLDAQNAPVGQPDFQLVHYGKTPLVSGLEVVPLLQAALLLVLIGVGVLVLRAEGRVERERVWAGMARESAHQLGTPLSSLQGWVELLRARGPDGAVAEALPHIAGDVERLERVAHRFERIGRPPRRETVDAFAVTETVAAYFRARLPTLARSIQLDVERGEGSLDVQADRVLLEWALESLVKNSVDALSGQGGRIVVRVDALAEGGARIRVADDGPGIPRELRGKIFSAGFTTKERGWGIGLALAKRIVEDGHRGRLALVPADRGATFDIILPA